MATAGFVCGLLGLIVGLAASILIGLVLSILGIVFGAVGKSKAGLVLGIIGRSVCIIVLAAVTGQP